MTKFHQRIHLIANCSVIIVSIILGTVLVKTFLLAPTPQPAARSVPTSGSKLDLPDIDWSQKPRKLVLSFLHREHAVLQAVKRKLAG